MRITGPMMIGVVTILLWGAPSAAENATTPVTQQVDLSGQWEIQEEERSYIATLDRDGNGAYTWQSGRLTTTVFADGHWEGQWVQPGNDREGGFEVTLSPDHTRAEGRWWYTRVGQSAVPSRDWGGPFTWTRLTPLSGPNHAP